jgi:Xaa-Pro aminopeptidase
MNRPDLLETPREVLAARKEAALARLAGGVMLLPSAPVQPRSRGEHPYHPDRELFYLTGATEPGTLAVLAGGTEPRLTLFVRERDAEAELWAGPRLGPEGAAERFRPDECHPLARLDEVLPGLLRAADRVFYRLGRDEIIERHVLAALGHARTRGARTGRGPRAVVDPGEILDDLRVVKDAHELGLLRRAAEITVEGHRAGVRVLGPGEGEWRVEAAIDGVFRASGGGGAGYQTIVGAGVNACVLHYVDNAACIGERDLALVDAGADYGLYQADVTRTWPASGRFTDAQRDVYEVVDAARRAALRVVRPGASIGEVHDAATRVLVEGLVELGALKGAPDALIEQEAYKPFYPHQTSHWLGLDVHDPGDYARDGESRRLAPGMVLTVEPGLYFRPEHEATPGALAGIGVRIEDDVVVTAEGHDVLTDALPTAAADVEALVGGRS